MWVIVNMIIQRQIEEELTSCLVMVLVSCEINVICWNWGAFVVAKKHCIFIYEMISLNWHMDENSCKTKLAPAVLIDSLGKRSISSSAPK